MLFLILALIQLFIFFLFCKFIIAVFLFIIKAFQNDQSSSEEIYDKNKINLGRIPSPNFLYSLELTPEKLTPDKHLVVESNYARAVRRGDKTYVNDKGYLTFTDSGRLVHRWVAAKKLGRKLYRAEEVHHRDGNKRNNKQENLYVCSREEHQAIHYGNLSRFGSWNPI